MPGYFFYRRPCRKSSGESCQPLKKRKSSSEEDDQEAEIKSRNLMVRVAKSNLGYGKYRLRRGCRKLKSSGENCPPCKKPKPSEENSNFVVDPQLCAPYASDIWDYLYSMEEEEAESKTKAVETVDWITRNVVVEWLLEVVDRNYIMSRTLYLAVSYLDRYFSETNSSSSSVKKLDLLAISCLLLASKYEEMRSTQPLIIEFCSLADYRYNVQEVVEMEANILKSLKFEMGRPTLATFLDRFTPVVVADQENTTSRPAGFHFLVGYFAETSLLQFCCTRYLPSMVAASVVFLSNYALQPEIQPWSLALEQCSGYRASEIKECVLLIHDLHCRRSRCSTDEARNKYQQPEFSNVASWTSPTEIPKLYFEDV